MTRSADVFQDVPDVARIWVIATDRVLTQEQQSAISSHLSHFFERWDSHGRQVVAQSTIERDRFVIVSAFVPGDQVSGCGIDASDHKLEEISSTVGFSRAPVLDVFFEADEGVRNVSRPEFARLAQCRDISKATIVYDTSLCSAGEWKRGMFARPVSELWHGDFFF